MREDDKRFERRLAPIVVQLVGLALLVAAFVVWATTQRESVLLVSAALTLIGVGSYERAARQLRDRLDERRNGGVR